MRRAAAGALAPVLGVCPHWTSRSRGSLWSCCRAVLWCVVQSAIADRDLASLQSAVKMADDMVFLHPAVAEAKALVALILEERRVLAELKKAIEVRVECCLAMSASSLCPVFVAVAGRCHGCVLLGCACWSVLVRGRTAELQLCLAVAVACHCCALHRAPVSTLVLCGR